MMRPLPLAFHRGQDRLRAEKDGLQVHVHHAIPEVLGHLREGAAFDHGPRVVNQHVEAAVAVLDLARHPLDLSGVRHVAPDEHRLAAGGGDPLDDLPRLVLAAVVVDRHPAARFGERHRRGGPDPRAAARDPRDLFRKHHATVTPLQPLSSRMDSPVTIEAEERKHNFRGRSWGTWISRGAGGTGPRGQIVLRGRRGPRSLPLLDAGLRPGDTRLLVFVLHVLVRVAPAGRGRCP